MFLVPWIQNEISKNMFFVPEMRSQVRNVPHYRMVRGGFRDRVGDFRLFS